MDPCAPISRMTIHRNILISRILIQTLTMLILQGICFISANINKELLFSYRFMLFIFICLCLCVCIVRVVGCQT